MCLWIDSLWKLKLIRTPSWPDFSPPSSRIVIRNTYVFSRSLHLFFSRSIYLILWGFYLVTNFVISLHSPVCMCRFSFSSSTTPFTFFASDYFVMSLRIVSDSLSPANTRTFKTFLSAMCNLPLCYSASRKVLHWPIGMVIFSENSILCFSPSFMFKCFMWSSTDMVRTCNFVYGMFIFKTQDMAAKRTEITRSFNCFILIERFKTFVLGGIKVVMY